MNKHHESPLISIIIPVFNGQFFIQDAYQVLINQHLVKFEIIFVDNNSTDDSKALIRGLIQIDSRVFLYEETEQGAASARNKGLLYARGGYIYFFDVDDELFDNAINSLLNVLLSDDSLDSVHGNTLKSNLKLEDTKTVFSNTYKITIPERYYWGVRWMHYGKLPGTPSFLHRNLVFNKIGNFNAKLKLGEDAAFHVKLGMECKVAHLDKMILLYYRHPQSTVSSQNKLQPKEFTYWEPLIYEHIPYLIAYDVPLAFKKEIQIRVYGYIPKMLALTKGYANRMELKQKLLDDILPLSVPILLKPFISLIQLSGSLNLYKVYNYYVLKFYMKYLSK